MVAVLLTHMLRKPVAIMNPPIICIGFVPTARTVSSAILRCNPHRCIANANINPPINRNMRSSAYGAAASPISTTPSKGNSASGNSDVAGSGNASVTHHVAINIPTDTVATPGCVSAFSPPPVGKRKVCEYRQNRPEKTPDPRPGRGPLLFDGLSHLRNVHEVAATIVVLLLRHSSSPGDMALHKAWFIPWRIIQTEQERNCYSLQITPSTAGKLYSSSRTLVSCCSSCETISDYMLQIAYIVTNSSSKHVRRSYKKGVGRREEWILERRGKFWAGVMILLVGLAYLVPYGVLSGVDAWYGSFLFWVVFGLAAIAAITAMTWSWKD